jgi:phosphoribosylaminoimidazole-succinocarboxamide synthase
MISATKVKEQLKHTVQSVNPTNSNLKKIEGKVRDCFLMGNKRLLIATDRLSAFDVVLTTIPFKGQVLTQMARYWFEKTAHIIPNHIISYPHPNVMLTQEVEILPIEVVVRGYLTGSAWRDYQAGKQVSGIELPEGMKKSQKFSTPLITPSTKAERGKHDLPISEQDIIDQKIVPTDIWQQTRTKALELFNYGSKEAAKQGLILVDTKYEFGILKNENKLILADEIHTPDSSRFWIAETYQELFSKEQDPEMLDKEFVRRELISLGYMGEGTPPELSDDFRTETALRYIQAYEKITGKKFEPSVGNIEKSILESIKIYL